MMIIRICVWVLPEGAVGGVGVAGDDLCCLHLEHGRQPRVEHHVRPLLAVLHSRVTLYVGKKYFFVLSTKIFGKYLETWPEGRVAGPRLRLREASWRSVYPELTRHRDRKVPYRAVNEPSRSFTIPREGEKARFLLLTTRRR